MKKTILILLLLFSVSIFSQERTKCVTVKEVTVRAYVVTEWERKKRKKRKKRKND